MGSGPIERCDFECWPGLSSGLIETRDVERCRVEVSVLLSSEDASGECWCGSGDFCISNIFSALPLPPRDLRAKFPKRLLRSSSFSSVVLLGLPYP